MSETIKIEKTHEPKTLPAAENLAFGRNFTDHMFVLDYTEGKGWHDPRIVPYHSLSMDPATMVLHYGQAVFEGLKAYRTESGRVLLFRPDRNMARLNLSNDRLCIPRIDEKAFLHYLKEFVRVESRWVPNLPGTSLYIRPFIVATEVLLGVKPSATYKFLIIASPVGAYLKAAGPLKILVEHDDVRAVRGGLGAAKTPANYAASLQGQVKAQREGCAQVLWLDGVERRYIEEVGMMNVFFKIGGKVITPELQGSILPGVTRETVIALLNEWGYPLEQRRISIDELWDVYRKGQLEEAFGTGTAAVISPIGIFKDRDQYMELPTPEGGPLAKRLYETITALQYGKTPDSHGWIHEIAPAE